MQEIGAQELADIFNAWWKVLAAVTIALAGAWRYLKRPLDSRLTDLELRADTSTRRDSIASYHDLNGLGERVKAVEHEIARHEVMHDQKETELAELQRDRKQTAKDIADIRADVAGLHNENKTMNNTLIRMDEKLKFLVDRSTEKHNGSA